MSQKYQLRRSIARLQKAIMNSVNDSEKIDQIMKAIREQGFHVGFLLETNIGLKEIEPAAQQQLLLSTGEPMPLVDQNGNLAPNAFTPDDQIFCKDLRIILNTPPD